MSNGADAIKKELADVDKQINPHTGKPHGEPETDRERDRREKFAQVHGRDPDPEAEREAKERLKSQGASGETTSQGASDKTTG